MTDVQDKPTLTFNDKNYVIEDLSDEARYIVAQLQDLQGQESQTAARLDQIKVATDGFKNFNSQKTLHVVIHNNALATSDPADISVSNISIWGYNSSLGGVWTMLTRTDRASGGETLVHPTYSGLSVAHDGVLRLIIPII